MPCNYKWPDERIYAIAVLVCVSESAGRQVFANEQIDALGMDSLDWMAVLVELGIEPNPTLTTVEDLIQEVRSKC